MLQNPYISITHECVLPPSRINVKLVEGSLKRSAESEAFIEQEWQKLLDGGLKAWPGDTKPGRYRLVNATVLDGRLDLILDPGVSYRDHAGATSSEFARRYEKEYWHNALAVTVFNSGYDAEGIERFLVSRRNMKHDYKPGGIHMSIVGFLAIKKETTGDPVAAADRELKEETGIEAGEVTLTLLGLAYDPWQNKPEIIFHAQLKPRIEVISGRGHDDENVLVWQALWRLPSFLIECAPVTVGPGTASALLVGSYRYGSGWLRHHNNALAATGRDYERLEHQPSMEQAARMSINHLLAS